MTNPNPVPGVHATPYPLEPLVRGEQIPASVHGDSGSETPRTLDMAYP